MTSPTAPSSPQARKRAREVLAIFALGLMLLALCGYGLWQWFGAAPAAHASRWAMIHPFALVAIPLALFVYLAAVMARHAEHARLAASYQASLDQMQKRLNGQEDLLHTITDYHPSAITIFDRDNHYWFINRRAAINIGREAGDVIGKTPAKVLGAERARKLEARLAEVRASGRLIEAVDQMVDAQQRVHFVQIHYEAVMPSGDFGGGVLMREEDLTSLLVERERRETMLRQVIQTLVAVVDRRDPYASGHSARVGALARAIAEEMMLDERQIEAAEIAGSLMNFGKVLVPREILTKTTPLTPDELQRVRDSILTSADILSLIDFAAPVVPTLRQVLERFDGTGAPQGLKGDDILVTARIVTTANAYVALVSPRAHRPSLPLRQAADNMTAEADKAFDRRVIAALSAYIENHAARLGWLTATRPPENQA